MYYEKCLYRNMTYYLVSHTSKKAIVLGLSRGLNREVVIEISLGYEMKIIGL